MTSLKTKENIENWDYIAMACEPEGCEMWLALFAVTMFLVTSMTCMIMPVAVTVRSNYSVI